MERNTSKFSSLSSSINCLITTTCLLSCYQYDKANQILIKTCFELLHFITYYYLILLVQIVWCRFWWGWPQHHSNNAFSLNATPMDPVLFSSRTFSLRLIFNWRPPIWLKVYHFLVDTFYGNKKKTD